MTPIPLIVGVSIAGGIVFGVACMLIAWLYDTKDENKRLHDAREKAYQEGYKAGGRLRFRERCQIERRCRELEKQIGELWDEEIQM